MEFLDELQQWLPVILPLMFIQLILMSLAIVMCAKSGQTRGPKWMWLLIIIFVNLLGPVAFMLFGRRDHA